jgi:hypothetical protein
MRGDSRIDGVADEDAKKQKNKNKKFRGTLLGRGTAVTHPPHA